MSVYYKEKPEYLRTAMDSMWNQTIPTDDFVLVCDGPLTHELEVVIERMQEEHRELCILRLPQNKGLGTALHEGLKLCKNELIARMDSDDISRPERCEKELQAFVKHPEVAIVGSWIEEFSEIEDGAEKPSAINTIRAVPEQHNDIVAFSKKRNPFNHPSVMIRKEAVLSSGNYPDLRYLQDYYLWIHMLVSGFKGYNIQEPLVYMRADDSLFMRRSGKLYREIQLNLFEYMRDKKYIDSKQYLKSCAIRSLASVAPNWLRQIAFKKMLRKKPQSN